MSRRLATCLDTTDHMKSFFRHKMLSRKKIQQVLYVVMLLNTLVVMVITGVSMSTEYWVLARPYRQIFFTGSTRITEVITAHTSDNSSSIETLDEWEDRDDEDFWPIDLYEKKDCKRYNGKVRFGLFKGVWVFNYAYGCKNRITRAYGRQTHYTKVLDRLLN